jgi:hypothetical protein
MSVEDMKEAPSGGDRDGAMEGQSGGTEDKAQNKPNGHDPQAPIAIALTGVLKSGGVTTKSLSLDGTGKVVKDSTQCWISTGAMHRTVYPDWRTFSSVLENMPPNGAIVLGTLREDCPDAVQLFTADDPRHKGPNCAARTKEFLKYQAVPTLMLFDHDCGHFSTAVKDKVDKLGGFIRAVWSICPELDKVGAILRASTSSGLSNAETGQQYPSSGGAHLYTLVCDGTDIPRTLKVFQDRCWLGGMAGFWINKAGRLLEYSIIDTSVAGAERLVFEANPTVAVPLIQAHRPAERRDGPPLDTRKACADLAPAERAEVVKLKAAAKRKLKSEADAVKASYTEEKVTELEAQGIDPITARERVEKFVNKGILEPGLKIEFQDHELGAVDVADILANPLRFDRKTAFDPIEGREYGHATAIFYANSKTLFSQAHGGIT